MTTVSATGGNVKTTISLKAKSLSLVGSKTSSGKLAPLPTNLKSDAPAVAVKDGLTAVQSVFNTVAGTDLPEVVSGPETTAIPPATVFGIQPAPITSPPPSASRAGFVADKSAVQASGAQTLALLASAAAVDPARAAYLKQFKDADPAGQFFTPASADYVPPQPPNLTDDEYRAFIADQVSRAGTAGFKQTPSGGLQYMNTTNQTVAVLYGPKAAGYAEVSGIRVIRPGQTTVLPGLPQGAVAAAYTARAGSLGGYGNLIAVAAVGYPPFTASGSTGSSSPIKTQPSGSALITKVNSILTGNDFSTLVSNLGDLSAIAGFKTFSTLTNLVGGLIYGYKGDFVGTALTALEAAGNGVMTAAADSKNPFLYLVGTAITTTSYTLNLAAHTDFSTAGSTGNYALAHPGVVVQETAKAAGQVLGHLGSAVLGSFGGVLKIFR